MTSIDRCLLRVLAAAWCIGLATATLAAAVPDDARESRWADEVAPQIVVGDAVWLATPHRARVLAIHATPGGTAKGAVIVVHGLGVHPDWGLVGEIRSALVEHGFATLSVQMPVLAADAPRERYAELDAYASERLDAAVAWLRAHGETHIGVLSHSMGASMVNAWMTSQPRIDAWVTVGMLVPYAMEPARPVLDVVGAGDYPEVLRRVPAPSGLPRDGCSGTATIAGADHFMSGRVPALIAQVAPFFTRAFAGECRASP